MGPGQFSLLSLAPHYADSFFPRYGTKNMIWYLLVCSMIGGLSVSVTTGLGAAIVTSVMGDNQVSSIPSASQCTALPDVLWG
jgi:hypothetical protein